VIFFTATTPHVNYRAMTYPAAVAAGIEPFTLVQRGAGTRVYGGRQVDIEDGGLVIESASPRQGPASLTLTVRVDREWLPIRLALGPRPGDVDQLSAALLSAGAAGRWRTEPEIYCAAVRWILAGPTSAQRRARWAQLVTAPRGAR
jgi:hypothetical protein